MSELALSRTTRLPAAGSESALVPGAFEDEKGPLSSCLGAGPVRAFAVAALGAALSLLPGVGLSAQPVDRGVLVGEILDAENGEPVGGAWVQFSGVPLGAVAGADGSFRIVGLPTGRYFVRVTARAHRDTAFALDVSPDTTRISLRLGPPAPDRFERARVVREALEERRQKQGRLADFYRRVEKGPGQYVTRDQLAAAGGVPLSTIFERYTNLRLRPCENGMSCFQLVTRDRRTPRGLVPARQPSGDPTATVQERPEACHPDLFLDGMRLPVETLTHGINVVDPEELEGIEVYRRGSQAPVRFARRTECGLVLLWSRLAGG